MTDNPVKNQCDGCVAGIPVNKRGYHVMGDRTYRNVMVCQKDKYEGNNNIARYFVLPPQFYGR